MKGLTISLTGLLLAAACFILGCKDAGVPVTDVPGPRTSYQYEGYDSKGTLVVTGVITLSYADSVTITGEWAFEKVGPSDGIGPQIGAGLLSGMAHGPEISINLNPGWADNNVILSGKIEGDRIQGKWTWVTFVGPTTEGTFTATKSQ
jgi:hypothetical protein